MNHTNTEILRLEDIEFGYNKNAPPLFKIKNFSVYAEERIFVSGESGSGKTSFLDLIAGLVSPQKGQIFFNGENVTKLSTISRDQWRGKNLGIIFQNHELVPYLTLQQNVELPIRLNSQRLAPGQSLESEIQYILSRLKLWEQRHQKAHSLSGGQAQRAGIARALIGRPSMILADEPTSAVDESNKVQFLQLLFDVLKELKIPLIFVSHELSLKSYFNRSVQMEIFK